MQPFLDNQVSICASPTVYRAYTLQIYFKNQQPPAGSSHPVHLPLPDVLSIVIDSFTGATERHIEVGDGLEASLST